MAGRERGNRRDGLAVALAIALVSLLLIGAMAVVLAALREHEDAEESEREATELVKTDIASTTDELVAALVGTSTIVEDDSFGVGIERWRRFATEAANASVITSLALEINVSDAQRGAFESFIGGPILERGADGSLVPAAQRSSYLPVADVVAQDGQTPPALIGFDIASESVRGRAAITARDGGQVVISEPVRAQTTGLPSFFVVKPLYRLGATLDNPRQRAAASIGFVTTAVSGQSLIEAAMPLVPGATRFAIQDGVTVVGSTDPGPTHDRATTLTVARRDWTLLVDDGKDPNYSLAWLIGVGTLLITGAVAVLLWTRIQAQRQHAADASRHARSADLAQKLAEARTTAAVAEAVHHEVPPLLDALTASVRILDDSQQVLQAVINEELPASLTERGPVPVNSHSPPGRAVLDRKWILLEDVAKEMDDYPDAVTELLVANEFRALVSVPLEDATGAVVGLLGVAWEAPHRFDQTTMALLRTVAELCEQTLERSRLHDSEHLLIQQLQRSALSEPPHLDHLDMSFRYQSAVQTLTMGGDWYDTVVLDDHTVALVVGDVAGHGVPAIAEMIELRSAIHALLRSRHPIEHVLTVADAILTGCERTRIATALVAVFDSRAECVQYVSAGHPPALLRSPQGSVEVLMDGRRPVLGVPPSTPCVVARRTFPPGSTFLAYTDGLVERRHEDLLVSIERLAADLAPSNLRGEELADAILLTNAPTNAGGDDIALVVVHAT
jgi:serine phosphatase RsbU (regulator of sigma subunit)/CHASE1-domain containing sensor protein